MKFRPDDCRQTYEDDGFVVDADDWEPFPLWFREDGGRVTSVVHGPSVYVPEGESPPKDGAGDWVIGETRPVLFWTNSKISTCCG